MEGLEKIFKRLFNKVKSLQGSNTDKNSTDKSATHLAPSAYDKVPSLSAIYRHYTAPDKVTAMKFLNEQKITSASQFIIVETPEGVFAKDITGIFDQ
jgi:hypothetical protein